MGRSINTTLILWFAMKIEQSRFSYIQVITFKYYDFHTERAVKRDIIRDINIKSKDEV